MMLEHSIHPEVDESLVGLYTVWQHTDLPIRIIHVGCVKLAQVQGASAQAAFGAGDTP